jgi:hypothetical protein
MTSKSIKHGIVQLLLLAALLASTLAKSPRSFVSSNRESKRKTQAHLHIPRGGAAKASKQAEQGGKASIATSIFNLSNNVAGAGILTLAAGKASGTVRSYLGKHEDICWRSFP